MQLRTSLTFWSATFFSALGLSPLVSCGGTVLTDGNGGHSGGSTSSGGSGTGGASPATGGGVNSGGDCNEFGCNATGGSAGCDFCGTGGAFPMGGTAGAGGSPTHPCLGLGGDGGASFGGYLACQGGGQHRVAPLACEPSAQRPQACVPYYDAGPGFGNCTHDSDCTAGPNGFCSLPQNGGEPACVCNYGCTRDADCGAGEICLCGSPVGQCVSATCRSDQDCSPGYLCLSYVQNPGCVDSGPPTGGGTGFACQTPGDQCLNDADCAASPDPPYSQCSLVNGQHRCVTQNCVGGRPFLIGGCARMADVMRRSDWASELAPNMGGLGAATRAELAARWTEAALMEHASIAAFARFALEILSLGAPPELVIATHSAMADETVHARDAFALASAYAGRNIGPGALDVGAALTTRTPLSIVHTAILEGCVGETVAAVEAAEALAHATDPAVREALARVVVDETKHAELAWRFVQWALEQGDANLRRDAAECLLEIASRPDAAAALPTTRGVAHAALLRAHGALDLATREEIRDRVVTDVIAPCARTLVAEHVARSEASLAARRSVALAS